MCCSYCTSLGFVCLCFYLCFGVSKHCTVDRLIHSFLLYCSWVDIVRDGMRVKNLFSTALKANSTIRADQLLALSI